MNEEDSLIPNMPVPGYISIKEAAQLLHLREKTVYRYAEEGKLPAVRLPSSSVLVEENAVRNYKRRSVGRPRTRMPLWRIPTGANIEYLIHIIVRIRPGQDNRLHARFKEIQTRKNYLLPENMLCYIARSVEKPDDVQIVLVWRTTITPSKEECEAAMQPLRDELADILDWETSWSEYGQVLMHGT